MKALILVALALTLVGCAPSHVPPAGNDCHAACDNLRGLSCLPDDARTPNGVECAVWYCETPRPTSRTSCVAKASSCEAARACK